MPLLALAALASSLLASGGSLAGSSRQRKAQKKAQKDQEEKEKKAQLGRALKGFKEMEQRKAQGLASLGQAATDFASRVR